MKFLPLNQIPLSVRILIAMAIGLIIGSTSLGLYDSINHLADAFIMLLQMTALPYIALSLMLGIGGLSAQKAKAALKSTLLLILLLMTLMLCFILMAPLSFPNWQSAEFYSANTVKVSQEFSLIALFIPSNPFNAFANAVIPSVVFFSILVGVGLMPIRNKRHTLAVLSNLKQAISNINSLVMRFAPIGIFCIGWRATATLDASQFDGLMIYIASALVLVLLLSFVVFPALIATVTPFGYRAILKASREAMITAFATGSFFVVIPIIVEKTKQLISKQYDDVDNADRVAEVLVPISYSLPVGGKLLALLFVLFAAWFSGAYISFEDYLELIVIGIPQLFGTSTLAMQNLLELFNVSQSMFDFFIVAENLVVGRLSALLSVTFASCLPILVATSMAKAFQLKKTPLLKNLLLIPLLSVVAFMSLKYAFSAISYQYQGYSKFIERDLLLEPVKSRNLAEASANSATTQPFLDVLTRIKQRGFLRVGYFRDDLPYAFHNHDGKLVGFDIEIMHQLAIDLDVEIEFVRIFRAQATSLLASGYLDITTGVPVIPDNMAQFTLTMPYSTQSLALLVKDKRRAEFTQWSNILARDDLILGIPESFYYKKAVQRIFTQGKAWEISTPRLFFKPEYDHIDAMVFGAAASSAWTLLNPSYTVVVPKPELAPLYMAFPINKNDHAFELFMRNWLGMKKQSGTIEQLFNYWIKGDTSVAKHTHLP
ncbi:amino acid ABC transporter substrate-binding protein, PAAT family [Colwellia chukchiensis]|uniref:Amino acid ABC transporter substrate-binding protein, PAAT family n=1 Tax=Colwellia chukchiensis TaxID=641665 RepID=A0A1H7QD03_9GAMM|nr:cation:dicarboxylase symporter family transporter [Colwellia chukchiensis]SEL45842.1 amino acid ABC transporter substrate-binding protein, PAAT family [Colwellia chukchiensis]